MFADLLFARPVMQISDVDQGKGQPGHVRGFGIRAIGEEDHDMLGGIFLVQAPEVRLTRPIWMSVGRDQYFLKSFKQTAKAIARTFNADKKFLLGKSPTLD